MREVSKVIRLKVFFNDRESFFGSFSVFVLVFVEALACFGRFRLRRVFSEAVLYSDVFTAIEKCSQLCKSATYI